MITPPGSLLSAFGSGDNVERELDELLMSLSNKPATIKLIMRLIQHLFKVLELTFKLTKLIDENSQQAQLQLIPILSYDQWSEIGKVLIYVLINYNGFSRSFGANNVETIPQELHAYRAEIMELSSLHLDIKLAFLEFNNNLTEIFAVIMKLVAINLSKPRNNFTGEPLFN